MEASWGRYQWCWFAVLYGPAALDWHRVLFRMSFLPLMLQSSSIFQVASHIIAHQWLIIAQALKLGQNQRKTQSPQTHIHFSTPQTYCVSRLMNFCNVLGNYRIGSWWQIDMDPWSDRHPPPHNPPPHPYTQTHIQRTNPDSAIALNMSGYLL